MSTEDAKAYLSRREVPRLFECLMTGLMFHRPGDHIQYLIDSLEKVKVKGQADLTWNMFVEVRSAKTPLPPITPDNGKRPVSRGRTTPKAEEVRPKSTPLPPIGASQGGLGTSVPVVFIMGGPGSGKSGQAERLCEKHPGWININLGNLLREKMLSKGADGKWKTVKDLVINGELVPEDITIKLLQKCIQSNTTANGFIVQGFPRDLNQAAKFEKMITRVDAMFLLDCEEEKLTNVVLNRGQSTGRLDDSPSALARRMATFKEHTLPVLKHYDDMGKLYIVNGDQEAEAVHDELSIIFETLLQNMDNGRIPSPPAEGRPSTGRKSRSKALAAASSTSPAPASSMSPIKRVEHDLDIHIPAVSYVPPPDIKAVDEGRKSDLPQAPIIFVAGGPGSGKGTQCALLVERYPDIVHLSLGDILRKEISEKGSVDEKWGMITKLLQEGEMAPTDVTEELLIQSMQAHPDAKAYVVEGYPRDALQYEDFNRHIGGQSFTILLDCDDQYLRDRLILRGASGTERIDDNVAAIEKKLAFFARNTLPLLKAIEDEEKLIVINGDRDETEVLFDIVKCIDFSVYGTKLEEVTDGGADAKADGGDNKDGGDDEDAEADGKAPVVEEAVVAASASVTGEHTGGNPAYTAELDALADAAAATTEKKEQEPTTTEPESEVVVVVGESESAVVEGSGSNPPEEEKEEEEEEEGVAAAVADAKQNEVAEEGQHQQGQAQDEPEPVTETQGEETVEGEPENKEQSHQAGEEEELSQQPEEDVVAPDNAQQNAQDSQNVQEQPVQDQEEVEEKKEEENGGEGDVEGGETPAEHSGQTATAEGVEESGVTTEENAATEQKQEGEGETTIAAAEEADKLYGLLKADVNCKSLLKNALNDEVVSQLKDKKSKFGGTLADCIRSGCENTDSGVGVYACDPDAYETFAPLLDPVIKEYHKVSELKHPECDFGLDKVLNGDDFANLDPSGDMIVSTRVRVGRSHDSYPFPPVTTKEQRVAMEAATKGALEKLEGEHKGEYFPLLGMTAEKQEELTEAHFLFNDHDRFLRSAGGYDDWPLGRGIFYNEAQTFLVWVNEEDHLRIISMQKGGDLKEVYARLVKGIESLSSKGLSFAKNDRFGYLTFCPSNLGTTLRASVHIKIPKLAASPEFKEFCDSLNIQARGIHGEHTESVGGVYDISNKRRLGLSEFDAIKEMYDGVKAIIQREKELQ